MFSKQFCVAAAPFTFQAPTFHKISQHFTAQCHCRRFTEGLHFPSFRKIQKALSFTAFTEWKTVTVFFLPVCRYASILCPMLQTHFAEILNSLLNMYSNATTRTCKRSVLTLILSFPKACILSQIHHSNSRYFVHHRAFYLDPFVLAFGKAGRFANASPIVYVRRALTLSINR